MGMAENTRKRGREQAGMSREGRRMMEKVLENTVRDTPSIPDIVNTRNIISRATRSTTNSLPKNFQHYNDIDSVNLLISLTTIHDITPPHTPDILPTHTTLLNDCFLTAPPPFLH